MTANYSDERRSFLKTVVLAGSAAAFVPLAKDTMASGEPLRLQENKSGQGYRETEHISKYYQTTKN